MRADAVLAVGSLDVALPLGAAQHMLDDLLGQWLVVLWVWGVDQDVAFDIETYRFECIGGFECYYAAKRPACVGGHCTDNTDGWDVGDAVSQVPALSTLQYAGQGISGFWLDAPPSISLLKYSISC